MGVSLGVYGACIGLHHLTASSKSISIVHKVKFRGLTISEYLDIIITCYLATVLLILLVISGDVERNPGPHSMAHKRYLTFCHANMRSIKKCSDKLDHIRAEFMGVYDIIIISENWLCPDDHLNQYGRPVYKLDGYCNPIRRDRVGRQGGGLLAWVSENCVSKRRSDLEIPAVEITSLEVRSQNNKVLFLVA